MAGFFLFQWAQTQLGYVGPAVKEPIDFLSRTVEFKDIAHYSQAQSGEWSTYFATYPREV